LEEEAKAATIKETRIETDMDVTDFSLKIHDIMSNVPETENADGDSGNDDEHEQSPVKKHLGSSKFSSCRVGACNVLPTEDGQVQQATNRSTSFLESFVHTYHQFILELAVLLKSDKAFSKFTQAIMSFLSMLRWWTHKVCHQSG
jgi:hypothetical protein